MAKAVKCEYCKKTIKQEPFIVKIGKRNAKYCNETCAKNHETKKKNRKNLTDYIQDLYISHGVDKSMINWTLLTSQIQNIQSEHKDWSDDKLLFVLKYMNEIEQVDLFNEQSNGSILSLLPFYYVNAKEFADKKREVMQSVKEFDFEDKVVKIKKNITEDEDYNDLSFD